MLFCLFLVPGTPSRRFDYGISFASMASCFSRVMSKFVPYLSSLALASENGFDIEVFIADTIRITGQLNSDADML